MKKLLAAAAIMMASISSHAGALTDTIDITWSWLVSDTHWRGDPFASPPPTPEMPFVQMSFEAQPGTFSPVSINSMTVIIDGTTYTAPDAVTIVGTTVDVYLTADHSFFSNHVNWSTDRIVGNMFWIAGGEHWYTNGSPNPVYTVTPASSQVPVPGSLALLGVGAIGLVAARRKHSDFIPA